MKGDDWLATLGAEQMAGSCHTLGMVVYSTTVLWSWHQAHFGGSEWMAYDCILSQLQTVTHTIETLR